MTEQQKQALREARLPKHRITSAEAYAQMTLLMGTPLKKIGKNRSDSGASSTAGAGSKE